MILASSYANAKDGFFAGIDINRSHARHTISEQAIPGIGDYTSSTAFPENKTSARNIGLGINYGHKKTVLNNLTISPELFFDQLNNRAKDPYANNGSLSVYDQDVMILRYRYGAKLNAGMIFAKKFNLFASAGLSYINYTIQWNSNIATADNVGQHSYSGKKLAPIYGIGLSYDITDNVFIKTTYDHQSFNIRYNLDGWRSKVNLNVFKIGLGYSF